MNELIHTCADPLPQATASCATPYGERITAIMFSKTIVTAAGYVPTASEFNLAYSAGDLAYISGISNTHRTFISEDEIEIIHKEWLDKKYRVDGKIKYVSEAIARMCELINVYTELYLYYITDKNYCFGPYIGNPNFTLITLIGTYKCIEFNVDYYANGIDYAEQDNNYEKLISDVIYLTTPDERRLTTPDGRRLKL